MVIDSRTLQSTPESGVRAGYDGAKRRKGAKVHGILFRMVRPILDQKLDSLNEQKSLIEILSTESKVRIEASATDRQIRGRAFGGGDINSGALSVLTRHVREATEITERWVALHQHQPSSQPDYRRKKLFELRTAFDGTHAEIQKELHEAKAITSDIRVRSGILYCQLALKSLVGLLHPSRGNSKKEPEIRYVVSGSLLAFPDLALDESWGPKQAPEVLLATLVKIISEGSPENWRATFNELADIQRNHEATERIIEYLSWHGGYDTIVDELATQQQSHIRQCQQALQRQLQDSLTSIENAVVLGLLRDKERAVYLGVIEHIKGRLHLIRNFGEEEMKLAGIESEIENSRKLLVDRVKQRLETERLDSGSAEHQRIIAMLSRGDVHTANEYIDLTLRGNQIPAPDGVVDVFSEFFPEAALRIDEFLSDNHQSGTLMTRVEVGKGLPGVDMKDVPGAQARQAVEMLEAWFSLKKSKRAVGSHLKTFFERLGFDIVDIGQSTAYPRAWVPLRVTPLAHRDQCPIPHFGSIANGNYRVLCIWDRPSEEEIVNQVRSGRQGSPAIVLYFGRLTEQKRRNLAQLSRADHLSFLLLDELLLVYLCGVRGSRLPVLFQCTLPFTFVSPYVTTASNVPPEMFYGRRTERTQIIDPMGSCFVYGGRQLGKTALLLSIRDEFHDPSRGRIALWIDLKALGATQDDIWTNLSRAFKDASEVDLQVKDVRSEQKLFERLQAWLDADETRRILLLLDEADRFLESDSKDFFARTSILKGWMEKTNRRFKVVFAGLHNVQRTTRQQNHPLAHFGEPICIGPLLDGGEWKEAQALITKPLWSMGFRFESPDLVTRILSQTNYYPSLIQLYCNQLFLFLARENVNHFDLRKSPPYLITTKHVDDAYSSRELRNKIRERFELTLNLDIRYRVIALIIALHSLVDGRAQYESLSAGEVRASAFSFWKEGFQESKSDDAFRIILEEMVGLGVLREIDDRYALRSPNLLSLLGTQDEIELKLLNSAEETPPPPFQPSVFRTSDQHWRRNPLTVLQEGELQVEKDSVTVILGSKASGLDDLEFFLNRRFPGNFEIWDFEVSDYNVFRKRLKELPDKLKHGTTLILIRNCPWSVNWLEESVEWCRKRAFSRFGSLVFVADPKTTWRLMQDRQGLEGLVSRHLVKLVPLQTWHNSVLWQWLGDCGIGSNTAEQQREVSAKTGNWPYLLMDFRRRVTDTYKWQSGLEDAHATLRDPLLRPALLEAFGLGIAEPYNVLCEMAELGGEASISELVEFLAPIPEGLISNVIFWAETLGIVRRSGGDSWMQDQWTLDPIAKELLIAGKAI